MGPDQRIHLAHLTNDVGQTSFNLESACGHSWHDTPGCYFSSLLVQLAINGSRGFTYLFDVMISGPCSAGVREQVVDAITIHNPSRLVVSRWRRSRRRCPDAA